MAENKKKQKQTKPGSKKSRKKHILLVILAVTVVLLFGGGLYLKHLRDPLKVLQPSKPEVKNGDELTDIAHNFDKDVINFALLGFDRTASRDRIYQLYRPDTILIASVNFRSGKINLLSIPRDSYVLIAGTNAHDKINHSFMYGHEASGLKKEERYDNGIKTVLKTVEELLGGVPIHYYFTVDMDGVVEIVDKLGGIEYDVDLNIYETNGQLVVPKGIKVLSGAEYLSYARYRGVGADVGRAERQQKLLIATFKQLKKAGKLVKLPQVYRSLTETVHTNLGLNQIAALALYGNEVDAEDIKSYVMPGFGQWGPQGEIDVSYWVINEKERVEVIEAIFGVTVAERPQINLPGPRRPPVIETVEPSPGHEVEGEEGSEVEPGMAEQWPGLAGDEPEFPEDEEPEEDEPWWEEDYEDEDEDEENGWGGGEGPGENPGDDGGSHSVG